MRNTADKRLVILILAADRERYAVANGGRARSVMSAIPLVVALASVSMGVLLAEPSVASAEQYLCVAEKSSGFSFDARTGSWNGTTFRTDAKYLIAPSKEPGHAFQVTQIGESYPWANCREGFNKAGYLFCQALGGEFKFNKKNGRFLNVYS